MTEKSKQITASLTLVNDRLLFNGSVEGNQPIAIDYIPPLGDNLGYTSLELLMLSLSSCVGTAILVILRKQGKNIGQFSIHAEGTRRQAHPTALEEIRLHLNLKCPNLSGEELEKALTMAENICPVWYMIKATTRVIFHHQIEV